MFGAAPSRLDALPPGSNLAANIREGEVITSARLVSILEIFADFRRPILRIESPTLEVSQK